MGNSIKPHIRNAEKTGVCQLQEMSIAEFPKELSILTDNLRNLDLSENKLSALPPHIKNFTHLKVLTVNNNKLSQIPVEIGELKKLETISFKGNHITLIPDTLSKLKSLRNVNFGGNRLNEFPPIFGGLKNLEVLDLSRNRIAKVTDCATDLYCYELNLNQNQVSFLSEKIAECPRLKVLRLEENCLQLTSIPTKLLAESKVSLLALDGNLFEYKDLQHSEGFEQYMERFTATKKKMY